MPPACGLPDDLRAAAQGDTTGRRRPGSQANFLEVRDGQCAQMHAQGSLMSGEELLVQATGRPLDPEVFRRHLEARYLPD